MNSTPGNRRKGVGSPAPLRSGGGGRRPMGGRRGGRGGRGGRPAPANSQPPDNTPIPPGLVFYCKTCEQIVDYKPTTFNFKYPIENCQKETTKASPEKKAEMICDIAYGTERSIKRFYKIKDDKFDAERRAREEKAQRADKL